MKGFFAAVAVVCLTSVLYSNGSLHASCKIKWTWAVNCSIVNEEIVSQIKKWTTDDNCKQGGEKCLYMLQESSPEKVTAKHTTPKAHYVDDLSFTFTSHDGSCDVKGYSTSELWYAILDYGTNYCNLHNLITGSGLDQQAGYSEETSDSVCTQYSSANCNKY